MNWHKVYDVIVVGGGHAGTEAALAAARLQAETLLLTHNIETVGQMSCNPAIGGIGKGHLVKEIDALGGAMAQAADRAGIQFRLLNASKGPAVRATRAQADRVLYKNAIRQIVETQTHLEIFQQAVVDILIEGDRIQGVVTQMGLVFLCRALVLTTGTFLGGRIHIGFSNYQGGRAGDPPSNALAEKLRALPFRVGRLKTGTPPRIDGRSINYSELTVQHSDESLPVFSFLGTKAEHPQQIPCYITHTNQQTHHIIREGLDRSPLFTGKIEGVGPRYCPSIEDKVVRFADKTSHQIFIEPEGLTVTEIYPNGISTSLPFDLQVAFVRSIKGFEQAHITRPGYAIEYDYFDPRDLFPSLQTKFVEGLFFAGQINGTTGYEEAAAQGLIAGLNAARLVAQQSLWSPRRDEAYMGVLLDDLTTRGTLEPYRMFTSRAEYRLLLREDNADLRLTAQGRELGLVNDERWRIFNSKQQQLQQEQQRLQKLRVHANSEFANKINTLLPVPLSRDHSLLELLRRPEVRYAALMQFAEFGEGVQDIAIAEQIEIQAKYHGYIERQQDEIERTQRNAAVLLPVDFNYDHVSGLSNEVKEKLKSIRPQTIGIAAGIPGVTPAAISLLMVHLKKRRSVGALDENHA